MFQVKKGSTVLAEFASFLDAFFWAQRQAIPGRVYVGGHMGRQHVFHLFLNPEEKR